MSRRLLRFVPPASGDPSALEQGTDGDQPLHALHTLREATLCAVNTPETGEDWPDTEFDAALKTTAASLQKGGPLGALELLTQEGFSPLYSVIKCWGRSPEGPRCFGLQQQAVSLLSLLVSAVCTACEALPWEQRPQGRLDLLLQLQRRVQQQQQEEEGGVEEETGVQETGDRGSTDSVAALRAAGDIAQPLQSLLSLTAFFISWLLGQTLKQLETTEKLQESGAERRKGKRRRGATAAADGGSDSDDAAGGPRGPPTASQGSTEDSGVFVLELLTAAKRLAQSAGAWRLFSSSMGGDLHGEQQQQQSLLRVFLQGLALHQSNSSSSSSSSSTGSGKRLCVAAATAAAAVSLSQEGLRCLFSLLEAQLQRLLKQRRAAAAKERRQAAAAAAAAAAEAAAAAAQAEADGEKQEARGDDFEGGEETHKEQGETPAIDGREGGSVSYRR